MIRPCKSATFRPAILVVVLFGWGCHESGTAPGVVRAPKPADTPAQIRLAYVTNGIASFWNPAAAGVKAGERQFGVRCEVVMPPGGVADQKRMIEDLLARGIDGLAISPIDAATRPSSSTKRASRPLSSPRTAMPRIRIGCAMWAPTITWPVGWPASWSKRPCRTAAR